MPDWEVYDGGPVDGQRRQLERLRSWNAYAYANGDPTNFNDPDGLRHILVRLLGTFTTMGEINRIRPPYALTTPGSGPVPILARNRIHRSRPLVRRAKLADEEQLIGAVVMNRWTSLTGIGTSIRRRAARR